MADMVLQRHLSRVYLRAVCPQRKNQEPRKELADLYSVLGLLQRLRVVVNRVPSILKLTLITYAVTPRNQETFSSEHPVF